MSRYADIVKKYNPEPENNGDDNAPVSVIIEKPRVNFPRPPPKYRNVSYDSWEYAYFPYLNCMYKIFYDDYDAELMYNFFRFIFYVSSGEISKHLRRMSEEERYIYSQYLIKKNSNI